MWPASGWQTGFFWGRRPSAGIAPSIFTSNPSSRRARRARPQPLALKAASRSASPFSPNRSWSRWAPRTPA